MDIYITRSTIQFKNPVTGQPTRHVADHYNGRRITAIVDGEQKIFNFIKEELSFEVNESDMFSAIEARLNAE